MRTSLIEDRGALFSPCRRYRYLLWRVWDERLPTAAFVLLNPSTADEHHNDPTIERCQRRALRMGYGGLRVTNCFAWRATAPAQLLDATDPVGPDNDEAILAACAGAAIVVCGWGTPGRLRQRDAAVRALLRVAGIAPWCFGINADGSPKHPLYVPYAAPLRVLPM